MPGFYQPSEDEFDPSTDDLVLPQLSKERRYKHFDLPQSEPNRQFNIDFAHEEKRHRFWPLLGFTDVTRRYVREKDSNGTWLKGDDGNFVRTVKTKLRPIRYAAHSDAAYLQEYATHLDPFYEQALREDGTSNSVLAYRKGGGTNIHHAKSLFDEIIERADCSVIAIDISGFFDCLDHIILRNEIAGLIGVDRLSGHHATVWKSITQYSWVETGDLDLLLGTKRNAHGRICSPQDFVTHVQGRKHGLILKPDLTYGIPQGTPVSGLYANIYLRTFDREMVGWCSQHGGSYRRYSDDIAIVLPVGAKVQHVVAIVEKLLADFNLALSAGKTETADFRGGLLVSPTPIQYLGFTFDGLSIRIRSSSLDAYRSKMRRGIHAKLVAAKMQGVPSPFVYERELRSRYTHAGKRRNFLRYAYKAAEIMGSHEIKQQVKPHMRWFNRALEKEVTNVYGAIEASA